MKQNSITKVFVLFSLTICLCFKCDQTNVDDCYKDRQTTKTLRSLNGIVKKINETFVIEHIETNTRYVPCNLTNEWKIENQKVIFSGLEKQTTTNEKWIGTPFVISQIKKRAY